MNRETLEAAAALGDALGHVFVGTASGDGIPHVASAGRIALSGEGDIVVAEWFCPRTMANLQENERITVVAWDPAQDRGHQMVGRVQEIRERSVIDGYVPKKGESTPPQVERELVIEVDDVLAFTQGPHSDVPE